MSLGALQLQAHDFDGLADAGVASVFGTHKTAAYKIGPSSVDPNNPGVTAVIDRRELTIAEEMGRRSLSNEPKPKMSGIYGPLKQYSEQKSNSAPSAPTAPRAPSLRRAVTNQRLERAGLGRSRSFGMYNSLPQPVNGRQSAKTMPKSQAQGTGPAQTKNIPLGPQSPIVANAARAVYATRSAMRVAHAVTNPFAAAVEATAGLAHLAVRPNRSKWQNVPGVYNAGPTVI